MNKKDEQRIQEIQKCLLNISDTVSDLTEAVLNINETLKAHD